MFNFKKVAFTVAIAMSVISTSFAPAAIEQHVNNDIAICTQRSIELGKKVDSKSTKMTFDNICEWSTYRVSTYRQHSQRFGK